MKHEQIKMLNRFIGHYIHPAFGDDKPYYCHYCPACDTIHIFAVDWTQSNGARWEFNGDLDKPSFVPSMKVGPYQVRGKQYICHYFVRAGMLDYCDDSTHEYKNKIVAIPPMPERFLDESDKIRLKLAEKIH